MGIEKDPRKDGGRPATKFMERHTQKTHPENRPDVDDQPLNFEEATFELPKDEAEPKKPDPNWQKGKYTQKPKEETER